MTCFSVRRQPEMLNEKLNASGGRLFENDVRRQRRPNPLLRLNFVDWMTLGIGTLGIIGTFIFGAWAILSYNATQQGNAISTQALSAQHDPSTLNAIQANNNLMRLNNQVSLALLCQLLANTTVRRKHILDKGSQLTH